MVVILDSTLREGELHAGVYFSKDARTKVGQTLAEIGTPRIEFALMYPTRGGKVEDVKTAVDIIQGSYNKSITVIHARALKEDIELARAYGTKGCAVYMAPTGLHRRDVFHGMAQQKVIDNFIEVLELAKDSGFSYRRATVEDASRFVSAQERAEDDTLEFLSQLLKAIEDAGATIVSIPDTSGILPQNNCIPFIETVKKMTHLPIACHFHNDYGNALGNALQAATVQGVEEVEVSIIGLGARNGITDHYELVSNLEDLYGTRIDEERGKLRMLYNVFVEATGIQIPWNHPLSEQCFMEKAGTHQSQIVRDPRGYIPRKKLEYDSVEDVRFEAGQFMSKQVVKKLFDGMDVNGAVVEEITNAIAARSALRKREVSPWEVKEIIEAVNGISIPIEKIAKTIKGSDNVYIMLNLIPQFPALELIQEIEKWKEVERVDEVYGDTDVIILSKMKDSQGENVVDKLRSKFKGNIIKTTTLAVE